MVKNTLWDLSEKDISSFNEATVKEQIVSEILRRFDIHKMAKFEIQQNNDRPDYIIGSNDDKDVYAVIEVKSPNEDLRKHIDQIRRYAYNFDAFLAILTNGNEFLFFSPFWRQNSFEERLIFRFSLKELNENVISEKVNLLFSSFSNLESLISCISMFEQDVDRINEQSKETKLKAIAINSRLNQILSEEPDIEFFIKHKDKLDLQTKSVVDEYLSLNDELEQIKNSNTDLEIKKPIIRPEYDRVLPKNYGFTKTVVKIDNGDFSKGFSDEVININALIKGKLLVLCKSNKLNNNRIFLMHKSSFNSRFECSNEGKKYQLMPKLSDSTNHIAQVEFLSIPGKNLGFWREMERNKEFDLWDVTEGPLKYFTDGNKGDRVMYFWLLRVFELTDDSRSPFNLTKGIHFKSGTMGNYQMEDSKMLAKIQQEFANGKYKPVVDDVDFNLRRTTIINTINKYR